MYNQPRKMNKDVITIRSNIGETMVGWFGIIMFSFAEFFLLYVLFVEKNSLLDMAIYVAFIIIFLFIIKLFESFLIYKIVLDMQKRSITFRTTLGTKTIRNDDIKTWQIVRDTTKFYGRYMYVSVHDRFFICSLKNGENFIYPIIGGVIGGLNTISMYEKARLFEKIFTQKPQINNGIINHKINRINGFLTFYLL